MAFAQKRTGSLIALALAAAAALPAAAFRYEARHDHLYKSGAGTLVIDDNGVSFTEHKKTSHAWRWPWQDIQQLELSPKALRVLTYIDDKWKLGADRDYRFDLLGKETFAGAYAFLKDRLDQRFVAELPDADVKPLWDVPAKRLTRFGGTQGTLVVAADRIVWRGRNGDSRTWRYADIDNLSTSGPFQLTLTTFERARLDYGNRKNFNFQLKQPLKEDRYDDLWRRVTQKRRTQ